MAQYVRIVYDSYRDLMDNKSDPRVNDWFLMSSPWPTLAICLSYAYFVKVLGPKLMENRKPFNLRKTMIYYNLFEVVFSFWLFYQVSHIRLTLLLVLSIFWEKIRDGSIINRVLIRQKLESNCDDYWLPYRTKTHKRQINVDNGCWFNFAGS